jgi:methionyl-tRNA formyltransferase
MDKTLRVVYFGTSDFALGPLKTLSKSRHEISAVVTQPDSKGGRSLGLIQSPVKELALKEGLKVLEYKEFGQDAFNELKALEADLFIVCSYGSFLPENIFNIPKYCLNIHPSLLPKYRGAAPVNWALINGDAKTGVSIFKVNKGMDDGEVALIKEMPIEESDNAESLLEKLSALSSEMILEALEQVIKGEINFIPQDKGKVVFARALKKEDGLINWDEPAEDVHNLIRGVSGWPGAYTFYEGKRIKVHKSRVVEEAEISDEIGDKDFKAGEVVIADKDKGLIVKCAEGYIRLLVIQQEGKKPLEDTNFLIGFKLAVGDLFTIS